ncbi:MAG: hypothetical protein H6Q30_850 [Bacteroidetes bacterium]|nr:hypothetical protein [Bacteroidota bacterium]
MTGDSPQRASRRPFAISVIAIINAIGLVVTIAFWLLVLLKPAVPLPGSLASLPERASAATTYGFMIGDFLWSVPLLLLAAVGLWRMRFFGWAAAQMANALWVYSLTVIWLRDAYIGASPGGVLFLPFALASFWAGYVLWKRRTLFLIETRVNNPSISST